ncbi:40770_t:CDS:1, partial [Gigaspora margarita]
NSALEQDNTELKSRNVVLGENNLDLITKLTVSEKELETIKESNVDLKMKLTKTEDEYETFKTKLGISEKERQASGRTIVELKTRLTAIEDENASLKKSLKDLNMQKMKDDKISQKRLDTIMKLKQNYQEQQELLEKLRKEENAKKYESTMRDVNKAINECNGGC